MTRVVGASSGQTQLRNTPEPTLHVVRRGETLGGIATRYGLPLAALEAANPSASRQRFIFPGDRLVIPVAGRMHTVRAGETLTSIATDHRTDWPVLQRANRLPDPDVIRVGQRLIVPSVPPLPRVQAAAPAEAKATAATETRASRALAAGRIDLDAFLDASRGSSASAAIIIGNAEGTRTPSGAVTRAYGGHLDPGNGVANRGSFSLQRAGGLTPEQADRAQLGRLAARRPAFEAAARRAGLDPSDATLATAYFDLYNQSQTAAARFLDQLGTLGRSGVTRRSVIDLRVHSFVDVRTGERFALPGGGRAGGGFVNIARAALERTPTDAEVQRTIRADQTRRTDAMLNAMRAIDRSAVAIPAPRVDARSPRPEGVGAVLPARGEGYVTYGRERGGADQVGTAAFVDDLRALGRKWARTGEPPIQFGDISRSGGGPFPPHSAHRRGNEVDIRPFRSDGKLGPMRWDDPSYDRAATRRFIEMIRAEHPKAVVLFSDPQLIADGLARRAPGHDNHLHVRL